MRITKAMFKVMLSEIQAEPKRGKEVFCFDCDKRFKIGRTGNVCPGCGNVPREIVEKYCLKLLKNEVFEILEAFLINFSVIPIDAKKESEDLINDWAKHICDKLCGEMSSTKSTAENIFKGFVKLI